MGTISVESSFSTLDVMLSGPAAFYGFRFDSNFAIPFSVMFRSCIVGYNVLVILHRFWKSVFVNSDFFENAD
jgi:hypothetical protein